MQDFRLVAMAALAAALLHFTALPAAAGERLAPDRDTFAAKPVAASMVHRVRAKKKVVKNTAHVYLLRGLMNIFSLGMDDLAQKIDRMGIATTLTNHSDWQELCDQITARYKAGNHGSIILIGHSLGADAVMLMGERLGEKGVPVALIVPFDGTRSLPASANVARVMNITQRDYAYMKRGYGFRGELTNVDVSSDPSLDHVNIDKSPRLHNMVLKKIAAIVKKAERGGEAAVAAGPSSHDRSPPLPQPAPPAAAAHAASTLKPAAAAPQHRLPAAALPSVVHNASVSTPPASSSSSARKQPKVTPAVPLEFRKLAP